MLSSDNQYSRVAGAAIHLIRNGQKDFQQAWLSAGKPIIQSEESRKKACPKAAFIGLCDHGFIRGIKGSRLYESKNFNYAAYAIQLWKKHPDMSKTDIWLRVQEHFGTTARHQGQLDVVLGVWKELNEIVL